MSDEEFERYWKAIEKNEKWEVGEEDFIPKGIISGVHKKRGIITEYLVCINKKIYIASKTRGYQVDYRRQIAAFVHELRPHASL